MNIRNNKRSRIINSFKIRLQNIFSIKNIIQFISVFTISIFSLVLLGFLTVNNAYSQRIVNDSSLIPDGIKDGLIIITGRGFENYFEEIDLIIDKAKEIHNLNQITKFQIISDISEERLLEKFSTLKDIPYEFYFSDYAERCKGIQKRSLIFTTGDIILRALFNCNFYGLYYTGYKTEIEGEGISRIEYIPFNIFVNDFINIIIP